MSTAELEARYEANRVLAKALHDLSRALDPGAADDAARFIENLFGRGWP